MAATLLVKCTYTAEKIEGFMSEMILFSTVNIFHLELESIGRRFVAKKT